MFKKPNLLIARFAVLALAALGSSLAASAAMADSNGWTTTTIKGVIFVNPKGPDYSDKIDMAELERLYPVSRDVLKTWVQDDLAKLNQEQLDQLYARITAGPIPDGAYQGQIVFTRDGGLEGIARKFIPIDPLMTAKFALLRNVGEFMWKGKHFYRDQAVLRNLIPNDASHWIAMKAIALGLLGENLDMNKLVKTQVGGKSYYELFPSKLYCGQSLLDSRRESVIIDYAFGDTVQGYDSQIDFLATRDGLGVRDEVRMVRPGLYLGRAYMHQIFGLIFTLNNDDAAKQGDTSEACWTGTQPRP